MEPITMKDKRGFEYIGSPLNKDGSHVDDAWMKKSRTGDILVERRPCIHGGYAKERVTRDGRPVEAGRCTECERPHDDHKAVDEATARMCNEAAMNVPGTLKEVLRENDGASNHPAMRKETPIASGFLSYFPDAIRAVARLSQIGNDQHNPGKPLHWDRSKSGDEADALMRHFLERGTRDTDGVRHSTKVAWRALALLQKEIEADQ